MNKCAAVTGLILLVLTDLASIISYATPYWIEYKNGLIGLPTFLRITNFGLWASCTTETCRWVFDGDSASTEAWFIAVQGLMSVGLAVSLTALLIATLALCCNCNCNYGGFIAGLLVTAFLATGAAVTVFGIYASKGSGGFNASIEYEFPFYVKFGWSFWLAAGASGMALLSSFLYACGGRE